MKIEILGSHLNASVKSYYIYTFSESFAFWINYGCCTYFHNLEFGQVIKNGVYVKSKLTNREKEHWRNNLLDLCNLK